jgi:tetratricopeptide (TPR) repeat protein
MKSSTLALASIAIAALTFFISANTAAGQQGAGSGSGSQPSGGARNSRPNVPDQTANQRPIFVTGKVVLSDGGFPNEAVKIERVCSNVVRLEGYTDRKGHFSFEIGRNQEFQDASEGGVDPFGNNINVLRGLTAGPSRTPRDQSLFGCDLRATLAGFRSDTIPLSSMHYLDNPDIGTILLHRIQKVDGLTVSATSALAPKDARKALEKGQESAKRNNPDEAQKNFEKAVELYPRYAAAWYELGRIQEQRDHVAEARKSFEQSVTADSKFIPPHERLAMISVKEQKWEEAANETDQVIRLNPFEYPDAYYFNGLANLQLRKIDLAEKNSREAIRLDTAKKNPRAHYVLGLALAQKQQFTEAATEVRTFLNASADAPDAAFVRNQLVKIEEMAQVQAQETKAAEPDTSGGEAPDVTKDTTQGSGGRP